VQKERLSFEWHPVLQLCRRCGFCFELDGDCHPDSYGPFPVRCIAVNRSWVKEGNDFAFDFDWVLGPEFCGGQFMNRPVVTLAQHINCFYDLKETPR